MLNLGLIGNILRWAFEPIRRNALFFFFMYLLGVVCNWVTIPHTDGAHIYENL